MPNGVWPFLGRRHIEWWVPLFLIGAVLFGLTALPYSLGLPIHTVTFTITCTVGGGDLFSIIIFILAMALTRPTMSSWENAAARPLGSRYLILTLVAFIFTLSLILLMLINPALQPEADIMPASEWRHIIAPTAWAACANIAIYLALTMLAIALAGVAKGGTVGILGYLVLSALQTVPAVGQYLPLYSARTASGAALPVPPLWVAFVVAAVLVASALLLAGRRRPTTGRHPRHAPSPVA